MSLSVNDIRSQYRIFKLPRGSLNLFYSQIEYLDITSNLYFLELFLYVNQGDIKVSQTSIRSIIQPFGRHTLSRRIREEAANIAFHRNHQDHINNGEEATYRNSRNELSYIANYSKGLGHRQSGEVRPGSYRSMLRAIDSGEPDDFERIRLGTPLPILPGDPKVPCSGIERLMA